MYLPSFFLFSSSWTAVDLAPNENLGGPKDKTGGGAVEDVIVEENDKNGATENLGVEKDKLGVVEDVTLVKLEKIKPVEDVVVLVVVVVVEENDNNGTVDDAVVVLIEE